MTLKSNATNGRIALVVFIIAGAAVVTGVLLPALSRPGGGWHPRVAVAIAAIWLWAMFACAGAWLPWALRLSLFLLGFVMIDAAVIMILGVWHKSDWSVKLVVPTIGAMLLFACGAPMVYHAIMNPNHRPPRDD